MQFLLAVRLVPRHYQEFQSKEAKFVFILVDDEKVPLQVMVQMKEITVQSCP